MELQELKDYLKIDSNEENLDLQELIEVSQIYIDLTVGENYKSYPRMIKLSTLWQKKLINDMHKNKSTEVPMNTKQDRITTTISEKLANCEVIK